MTAKDTATLPALEPLRPGELPTNDHLRAWTGEPHIRLSDEAIALLFGPASSPEDVPAFEAGAWFGSRSGGVYLLAVAHQYHDGFEAHAVYAHLCAHVWRDGKVRSALAEYGLEDEGIYPEHLLAAMQDFRCSPVIMSEECIAAFDALPERFTVWRGGALPPAELRCGHSWTTRREVAERFARIAAESTHQPPSIVWRRVRKADVIAYFADREEAEVVLWPSRRARALARD